MKTAKPIYAMIASNTLYAHREFENNGLKKQSVHARIREQNIRMMKAQAQFLTGKDLERCLATIKNLEQQ